MHDGRVLVTGATGFVGRATTTHLADLGFEVHGVARTRVDDPGVDHLHEFDLLADAPEPLLDTIEPTHLVHLAWVTEHGEFWNDPVNVDWCASSLRLVRAFEAAGGQRALLTGSCAEYDWDLDPPFAEDAAGPPPATLYGACKLATATAALAFGRSVGVEIVWARLFHLYGPGEDERRLVPSLLRAAERGQPLALRQPASQIDLLHVDDVGRALARLLASTLVGACNVASGEPRSIADVGDMVTEIAGAPSYTLAEDASGPPSGLVADIGRLRDATAFRPRHSLRDGLTATRQHLLQRG